VDFENIKKLLEKTKKRKSLNSEEEKYVRPEGNEVKETYKERIARMGKEAEEANRLRNKK